MNGTPPTKACLTLPALYGPAVEKLLREAAQAADFTDVELIPEPVSAAQAWLTEAGETGRSVAVLDCGGGTLDLAYLGYEHGQFRIIPECPPGGDTHVGGHDVDRELLNLLREQLPDAAEELDERQPFYLRQVRVIKERYCRNLPMRPLKVSGQALELSTEDIQSVLQERFIVQTCESLKAYMARVVALTGGEKPPVLLVGGSARIKGLKEAIETQSNHQTLWWERSEFATVLGALQKIPSPKLAVFPVPQDIHSRETGRFVMGSPEDEPERMPFEGPQQIVTLSKPFALARYALTFEEYDAYCESTGENKPSDSGWGRGRRPVINVSWDEAVAYCRWLTEQTGAEYRLPSEAEWEYACRAGTTTPFWWGNTISPDQANYDGNYPYDEGTKGEYRRKTLPVDHFEPNPWGLHQMNGGVWEWVLDWFKPYCGDEEPEEDPGYDYTWGGSVRVCRGGSWADSATFLRTAFRFWYLPYLRNGVLGFRPARTL